MKRFVPWIVAVCLIFGVVICGKILPQNETTAPQSTPATGDSVADDPATTAPGESFTELPEEEWPDLPLVTSPQISLPGDTMPQEPPPDIPPPQPPPTGPQTPDREER